MVKFSTIYYSDIIMSEFRHQKIYLPPWFGHASPLKFIHFINPSKLGLNQSNLIIILSRLNNLGMWASATYQSGNYKVVVFLVLCSHEKEVLNSVTRQDNCCFLGQQWETQNYPLWIILLHIPRMNWIFEFAFGFSTQS